MQSTRPGLRQPTRRPHDAATTDTPEPAVIASADDGKLRRRQGVSIAEGRVLVWSAMTLCGLRYGT